MTDNRVRIKKWITENLGEKVLEKILSGKTTLLINDKPVLIDEHFSDRRVSPSTKIETSSQLHIKSDSNSPSKTSKPVPTTKKAKISKKPKAAPAAAPSPATEPEAAAPAAAPSPATEPEAAAPAAAPSPATEPEAAPAAAPAAVKEEEDINANEEDEEEEEDLESSEIPTEKLPPPKQVSSIVDYSPVKNFLTTDQINAINSKKAKLFVCGEPITDLETPVPVVSGKPTNEIKVVPQFRGG